MSMSMSMSLIVGRLLKGVMFQAHSSRFETCMDDVKNSMVAHLFEGFEFNFLVTDVDIVLNGN